MTNNVRRFDKTDWCGFAGATTFADGSDPFIGEVTIEGVEMIIIGDVGGISVVSDGDTHYAYRWDFAADADQAFVEEMMQQLCSFSTEEELLDHGFVKDEF